MNVGDLIEYLQQFELDTPVMLTVHDPNRPAHETKIVFLDCVPGLDGE